MGSNFKYLISLIILLTFLRLNSQEVYTGFQYYLGSGKSADLGLSVSYTHHLNKKGIAVGAEIRSIDWGNHLGLILAFEMDYFTKKAIKIGGSSALHPGLALFQQKQLGSFGIAQAIYLKWQSKKRSFLRLDLGLRYNVCPGYKAYGNHKQLEFPIVLNWGWALGKTGSGN